MDKALSICSHRHQHMVTNNINIISPECGYNNKRIDQPTSRILLLPSNEETRASNDTLPPLLPNSTASPFVSYIPEPRGSSLRSFRLVILLPPSAIPPPPREVSCRREERRIMRKTTTASIVPRIVDDVVVVVVVVVVVDVFLGAIRFS
jgi:hypothetical protein